MIPSRKILEQLRDYVPGKSIQEIRERTGLTQIVKLASNENPLGASPMAMKAMSAAVSQSHLYPRGEAPELINALAAYTGLTKDCLVLGNGSDEILSLIAMAYLETGLKAISAKETFSIYESATIAMGAQFLGIPLKDWRYDLQKLAEASVDPSVRVIFLCNPNNPTGTWVNCQEVRTFLNQVPPHVLVVVDQAYCEFADDPSYPMMSDLIPEYPNLLLVRTFSKVWGLAGLRVGYALGNPQVISTLWKLKPPFNVNTLAQVAATAALSDAEHLKQSLWVNSQGKEQLYTGLARLGFCTLPTQGNFIAVELGPKALQWVIALENQGVIIRSLKNFAMPEWVRVTVGLPSENEFFLRCLEQITGVKS